MDGDDGDSGASDEAANQSQNSDESDTDDETAEMDAGWPMFQYDTANAGYKPDVIDSQSKDEIHEIWQVDTGTQTTETEQLTTLSSLTSGRLPALSRHRNVTQL